MKRAIGYAKLYALLVITQLLLTRAARTSRRVAELMRADRFVLQICTADGRGGYYVLENGRISLRFGTHPTPDFAQIWTDGAVAFSTLTSSDESDIMRAFEAGLLRMSGHFRVALWFNECMKIARGNA